MIATVEKIDLNNLDKSDWKSHRFDQIAQNISERIDPNNTDLEVYIGLEHIDSESLQIKRFGSPDDVNGQKLKFYNGDIIFGRRRAYQRKAGIATCDGFCSAHALVLRANPEVITPELFPFFLHSDLFMNRAIDISVGSLSPTINWGILKHQEFRIPPMKLQEIFVKIFGGVEELIISRESLSNTGLLFLEAQKNDQVLGGAVSDIEFSGIVKSEIAKNWEAKTISQLFDEGYITHIQDGNHGEMHPKSSDYAEEGIPFIMANTLVNGEIDFEKSKKLPVHLTDKLRVGFSKRGDVLLSHKGTVGQVAIVPNDISWPYLMLTPQVTYYRLNSEKLSAKFLYFVFTSKFFQQQLSRISSQSTRAYIGITAQKSLKIVIPPTKKEQDSVVDILMSTKNSIETVKENIGKTTTLKETIINQVF